MVTLREAFGIEPGEVITLVGAGGKTTLMFALARELSSSGGCVITTTTTKFLRPTLDLNSRILLNTDEEEMTKFLLHNISGCKHITLATKPLAAGKLKGISPVLLDRLAELGQVTYIIVEADGAAGRPLKAPNSTEPVIPSSTSLVIPVVGLEAIGKPLTGENVFRPEITAKLTGLSVGDMVTAEAVAVLVTHPSGIAKGSPAKARIIPFLNKADLPGSVSMAGNLAKRILESMPTRVERVVIGQAALAEPVVEVVCRAANLSV